MKVVFEESIKESDGQAIMTMLRRVRLERFENPRRRLGVDMSCLKVSVDIDVDRINMAGMTALHQVTEQRSKMMQTGEDEMMRRKMK